MRPHVPRGQIRKTQAARLRTLLSCPACGKKCFESRRDAKADAARQAGEGGPRGLRPYRCGDYWHLTSQDTATRTAYRELQP